MFNNYNSDSADETPAEKTLVFIEGNISAGKSTLIEGLREKGHLVWTEAVDQLTTRYRDRDDKNLLELFYTDMEKHAFKLQVASLASRWKIVKEALEQLEAGPDMVFIERSIFTDLHSFALNLYEQGHISVLEWKIYFDLIQGHLEDASLRLEKVNIILLYLKTDPEECARRLTARGRAEESTVSLQYLQSLHGKNEKWLLESEGKIPRVVINGHDSKENVLENVLDSIYARLSFPKGKSKISHAEMLSSEIKCFSGPEAVSPK